MALVLPFRGYKENMAANGKPEIRGGVIPYPEGPSLGLVINEDWLRQHMAKGETCWGRMVLRRRQLQTRKRHLSSDSLLSQ